MTSSSEGEILQTSQVIRERWKIKAKIGGGGFGEIYEATDLQNHNERVAVKVESSKATKQVLKMEVAVLRRLQGKKHACKFYGCGRNDKFNYLVMSLQAKNLADLRRESPKQSFSVSTAIRIGIQILNAIREIHSIGFLHRDIKPSNFAMGRTTGTMKCVYMLDFGLARQYLNAKGEIRSPRSAAGFRGTVRYAAVSAHKNREMGRQDDLWSLFYMLVEFILGALPWRKIKDKDEVGRMKDEVNFNHLLEGCPRELHDFAAHLQTLGYPDEPNYDLLETCLKSILIRHNISYDEPYDWELGYENLGVKPRLNGVAAQRNRSHTTAVKDRGPEDKNRALETQAPITMGEDDDEQTGAHGKGQVIICEKDHHDKPKYKRQEFMRPKYGAVSFDVIDAVNARLAAVSGGTQENIFSNLRVETSVENDKQKSRDGNAEVHQQATTGTTVPTVVEPVEAATHVGRTNTKAPHQSSTNERNKSNRSITLSIGKRYNKKLNYLNTSAEGTYAMADDDAGASSHLKAQTIISRWHGSFDESYDDPELQFDGLQVEKSDNSADKRSPHFHENRYAGVRAFPRSTLQSSHQKPMDNNISPTSPSSGLSPLIVRRPRASSTAPMAHVATLPVSTPPTCPSIPRSATSGRFLRSPLPTNGEAEKAQTAPTNAPVAVTTSSSLMSHFKNLVHTFNSLGTSGSGQPRRSLSRGVSLEDARVPSQQTNLNSDMRLPQSSSITQNLQRGPSLVGTKVVTSIANTDEEKELRRQRRLRRRSDCQLMMPQQEVKMISMEKPENGIVRKTVFTTDGRNGNSNVIPTRFLNNGREMNKEINKPLDEAKARMVNCRRKRYQFLNFSPRAAS